MDTGNTTQTQATFRGDGVPRRPHHYTRYTFPDLSLLPEGESLTLPPPFNCHRRPQPKSLPSDPYDYSFFTYSAVDSRPAMALTRDVSPEAESLTAAMDSIYESCGSTKLSMVTYSNNIIIKRQTFFEGRYLSEAQTYDINFSPRKFFLLDGLYAPQMLALQPLWWHNLRDLWGRTNERAYFAVAHQLRNQGLAEYGIFPVKWHSVPQNMRLSRASRPNSLYAKRVSQQGIHDAWSLLEKKLEVLDVQWPPEATNLEVRPREMLIDLARLIRASRRRPYQPVRFNPAHFDEAEIMMRTLSNIIPKYEEMRVSPHKFFDELVFVVLDSLRCDSHMPGAGDVAVTDGFASFLYMFVRRLVNCSWLQGFDKSALFVIDHALRPASQWDPLEKAS